LKKRRQENEKADAKKSKAATPSVNTSAEAAKPKAVGSEDVLAVMKKLSNNGIVEFNSRQLSDKLGYEPDRGRQKVRQIMKRLETEGKVEIKQKKAKKPGARRQYVYSLK